MMLTLTEYEPRAERLLNAIIRNPLYFYRGLFVAAFTIYLHPMKKDLIESTFFDAKEALQTNPEYREKVAVFLAFMQAAFPLRGVTEEDVTDMIAQHWASKPVFDDLFGHTQAAKNHPMTKAMEPILALLERDESPEKCEQLQAFYEGIRKQVGIENKWS